MSEQPLTGVGPRGAAGAQARSPKQIADEQITKFGGASPANIRGTLESAYWADRKDSAQYRRLQRAADTAIREFNRPAPKPAAKPKEPMDEVERFLMSRDPGQAGASTQPPSTGNRAPANDRDRTEALNRLNGPRWGVPREARGSFSQALDDWQRYGQNAGMPPPKPSDYPDYRNPQRPR
jgi:hypothetical protein